MVRKDTLFGSKNVVKLLEVDCYDLQVVLNPNSKEQKKESDEIDMLSMV
jgi:hypothetical protein